MKKLIAGILFTLIVLCTSAIAVQAENSANNNTIDISRLRSYFSALPEQAASQKNQITDEKIALGKKLFFEKKLSKGQDLSCNSCHNLATYGVDNAATSAGHMGKRGDRNSPTVYNAALHFSQFWDGRAADVEEQALGPIQNPIEMAMEPGGVEVLERLKVDPSYPPLFKSAFPTDSNPISFPNIGLAIGAFERTLITPSRFDKFIKGDNSALTPAEITGLQTFVEVGCIACHNGATLGGTMFQKLGLVTPYQTKDLGRYKVTQKDTDKYFFKVPSLRNVEKTAPYFHDGKIPDLASAVKLMGEHQLARPLTAAQVDQIVTFLKTLTGELPAEFK